MQNCAFGGWENPQQKNVRNLIKRLAFCMPLCYNEGELKNKGNLHEKYLREL